MLGLEVITGSQKAEEEPVTSVQLVQTDEDQVFYDILPDSSDVGLNRRPTPRKRSDQSLPYVMTGVLLDTSRRVGQIFHTFDIVTGRVGRTVEPIISPLINNPVVRPFKNRFDGLVRRGEGQVDHWKQLGMDEDTQGRELIETITFSTIDTSIDYVAQQPEVYELATSKTKSFASVILDYIRSIFVSLDIILLGIIAKVFRLSYLMRPETPSDEIRKGATSSVFGSNELFESTELPNIEDTQIGSYTGFINRISALFIDLFIVGIMLNIGIWFIRTSAVLLNIYLTDLNLFDLDLSTPLIISIIGAAMFAIYNTLLWTLFGSTFGQALLGIRVLTKDGALPGNHSTTTTP